MRPSAPSGLKPRKVWGRFLGAPTMWSGGRPGTIPEQSTDKEPVVKKLMLISLAVAALLLLALGGWAVQSLRRTPVYA
jgi:hypothetical protein